MEGADNYFVRNDENGKLHIYTNKSFYASLLPEQKKIFTSYCLFSRGQECWISKGKYQNCSHIISKLSALKFIDKGTIGEKLPFAEQVKRSQEKAEARIERAEKGVQKAKQRSSELYSQAKDMASFIPFGQPILIGHHSEKRDRNYRSKIENKFNKAFEELDKADYYAHKVEISKSTAEGVKFQDPVYLTKKIKECQKNLKVLGLRLEGKRSTHAIPVAISEEARSIYQSRVTQENDKLSFFVSYMKNVNPDYSLEVKKKLGNKKGKSLK